MAQHLTLAEIRTGDAAVLIEARQLGKHFGGIQALDAVDLRIAAGTVHALVGENGAGKSTLGNIIGGAYVPDHGQLLVRGKEARFHAPRQALSQGIAMIAQELTLVPQASVLENVFLGVETHRGSFIRERSMRRELDALLRQSHFQLRADARVDSLNVADQQKVEILRAIARRADLIVMDEPTARLTAIEAKQLLGIVRSLRERGTTVVYVSHHLDEVLEIADNVTVLRNGRLIETVASSAVCADDLVRLMVGRSVELFRRADAGSPNTGSVARPRLRLQGLSREPSFRDITFDVQPGELLVLTGLVGSGRSEVARAIFGIDRPDAGTMLLDGEPVRNRRPRDAIRRGIALLPESRKEQGLVMIDSVICNVALSSLRVISRWGMLRKREERRRVGEVARTIGLNFAQFDAPIGNLSGGNQQKALFAKWLLTAPRLFIVDEPTRGVDVGAKGAIYDLLRERAASGMGILVISSEIEEVVALASRVLVMREGRIVAQFEGDEIREEFITPAVLGVGAVTREATS